MRRSLASSSSSISRTILARPSTTLLIHHLERSISTSIYPTSLLINSNKMTGVQDVLEKVVPALARSSSQDASVPAPGAADPAAGPTKGELKKAQKEKEKAERAAEKEAAKAQREKEAAEKRAAAAVDYSSQNYGKLPLNQSRERAGLVFQDFADLSVDQAGQKVTFRARLQNSRAQGAKMLFFTLRQQSHTVQGLLKHHSESVSPNMVKFAEAINPESIVLVEGTVVPTAQNKDIKSCTIQKLEINVSKIHVISEAPTVLPFPMADASRVEGDESGSRVPLDTRLDNRVLDLRTATNQAIFQMSSGVNQLFRNFLNGRGFIEIHTPKLQAAATESGASVFKVSYFKGTAYLAQSPQLAKQMCIAADMEKVYEIGPVFRAENSYTHRHMTEFIGLDLEMTFNEHYHEVMETIDAMLRSIFQGLKDQFAPQIETIKKQFPHEDFIISLPKTGKTLILTYAECIKMLQEKKIEQLTDGEEGAPQTMQVIGDEDDMSTATEIKLGEFVKEIYGVDYYIIDKFPTSLRPFYTMADGNNPRVSNSYDFMMRGQEILSGAQRVHDADMLEAAMVKAGINPAEMKSYLDAFKLGMPPHAGGGIGLERVVMLFLKLENIRRASLFPRDPKRLEP